MSYRSKAIAELIKYLADIDEHNIKPIKSKYVSIDTTANSRYLYTLNQIARIFPVFIYRPNLGLHGVDIVGTAKDISKAEKLITKIVNHTEWLVESYQHRNKIILNPVGKSKLSTKRLECLRKWNIQLSKIEPFHNYQEIKDRIKIYVDGQYVGGRNPFVAKKRMYGK